MAKGRKTGGRDFPKGWEGGPGRPALPDDVKLARSLTATEFTRLASDFLWLTRDGLDKKLQEPGISMLEQSIGKLVNLAANGDHVRLEVLLNRIIGKPPADPQDTDAQPTFGFMAMTPELIAAAIKKARESK